jgi:hypothetical protein
VKAPFRSVRFLSMAAAALAAVCAPSLADSVSIPPSRDNTLIESDVTLSCGSGPLFGGRTSIDGSRRIVIRFNVAGSIPAGSTINSAALEMSITRAGRSARSTDSYELHRLLADWGEGASSCAGGSGGGAAPGDATWGYRFFATDTWSALGGDFNSTASAVQLLPTLGAITWASGPALVADVQSWLASPSTDFGWIMIGNESSSGSVREFASRESTSPPLLVVDYTPATPGPPEVPDGRNAPPVLVEKLSQDGSSLLVQWDTLLCSGNRDHQIVYGVGPGLPAAPGGSYALVGSVCALGSSSPFTWSGSPDPTALNPTGRWMWFLVLANDGGTTEGSWGRDSFQQERTGTGAQGSSGQCGILSKNLSNICGQSLRMP